MPKLILKYLAFFILSFAVADAAVYYAFLRKTKEPVYAPANCGTLPEKLGFFIQNKQNYKMVYVGDSRTYTNINNLQLDSLLRTSSFNLGAFANWLPNQYAFFQDFLPHVPDSTIVIYSIGHQNFGGDEIQNSYPINSERANEYYKWGFTISDLKKPIRQSLTIPSVNLLACHGEVNCWLTEKLKTFFAVIFAKNEKKKFANTPEENEGKKVNFEKAESIKKKLASEPEVLAVSDFTQNDTINSVAVSWKRGNYTRIEVDSLFHRNMQRRTLLENLKNMNVKDWQRFELDERYWKNFQAIVELLKKHKARLKIIFNEVEEAPNQYVLNGRGIYQEKMNSVVREYVKKQGFTYIKVPTSDLPDYYYFDYNHFNSKGNSIYSARLADTLKTYINKHAI